MKKYYIYAFVAFILISCEKNKISIEEKNSEVVFESFEKNTYNLDFKDFAIALSKSLNASQELKKIIKSGVKLKFDGDYNILLKSILNNNINIPEQFSSSYKAKSKSAFTVKDLLLSNYDSVAQRSNSQRAKASSIDIIDELIQKYPKLQIAVPVNVDKWDITQKTPILTFIPSEYEDGVTKTVTGYKPDGSMVIIDAIKPPSDDVVIVIGENEGTYVDNNGNIIQKAANIVPEAPSYLAGSTTQTGVRLTWTTITTNDVIGYKIYRKGTSDSQFQYLATNTGSTNKVYDDNKSSNLEGNAVYAYYVTAISSTDESNPSNIINCTFPPNPNPALSFSTTLKKLNEIELRWDNDYTNYFKKTNIYKKILGLDSDYNLYGEYTPDQHGCFDTGTTAGKQIFYRINQVSDLGVSNAKYDFIYAPYRDISRNSPVYIKYLSYTCNVSDLEGWLKGAPEFEITVFGVNSDKKTYQICKLSTLRFPDRDTKIFKFTGRKVLDWKPGVWSDMLTFHVVEEDNSSFKKIAISAKVNVKDSIAKVLSVQGGIEAVFDITDNNEVCGDSWINYFDNPNNTWMQFQNYGFKILVSDNDY